MRGAFIKGLVVVVVLVVVLAVWILAGRHIVMLMDRVKTVFVQSLPATPIDYRGSESDGTFVIGDFQARTETPNYKPYPLQITLDSQSRSVLSVKGKSFVLSTEPGDETSFSIERSWTGWSTPFDFNFMTGISPMSRRNVYYVLRWKKSSGARLKMVWRYEQVRYSAGGWSEGYQTRLGATGLIDVQVSE
jgi:hypothetical protein